MLRSIVVPLDGSDFANRALPVASVMAQASHTPMRIVGVAHADDELPWIFDHVHEAARAFTGWASTAITATRLEGTKRRHRWCRFWEGRSFSAAKRGCFPRGFLGWECCSIARSDPKG